VLELREIEKPVPAAGEVLIRVAAAGLNRADIYTRTSASYGGDTHIPGLEVSGIIEATGPGAIRWKPGDAVCALVNGGGYAEYVAVPAGQCLPVPAGWSLEEAAGLPEAVLTVWLNAVRTATPSERRSLPGPRRHQRDRDRRYPVGHRHGRGRLHDRGHR
jgi:NADPH2:quinone reductase